MKKSFENSFTLFTLLKKFIGSKGKSYRILPRISMLNDSTIRAFIERNNHLIKTDIDLSNLLESLLGDPKNYFPSAGKN